LGATISASRFVKLTKRHRRRRRRWATLPPVKSLCLYVGNRWGGSPYAGHPTAVNDFNQPLRVEPVTSRLEVGPSFDCELPAHSLTVWRVNTR
jgi:hypothetical protein